jgi:hypothetical protein
MITFYYTLNEKIFHQVFGLVGSGEWEVESGKAGLLSDGVFCKIILSLFITFNFLLMYTFNSKILLNMFV